MTRQLTGVELKVEGPVRHGARSEERRLDQLSLLSEAGSHIIQADPKLTV